MKNVLKTVLLSIALVVSSFAGSGGDILRANVMIDNLEYQFNDEKTIAWDSYVYIGYDLHKVYLYSEGEKANEMDFAESENQLVYSHAITSYWDIQVGLGHDKTEKTDKLWGVIGVQGLAPYFFETRAVVLIGDDGGIGLRVDLEYEALFTQKLILTHSIGLSAYTKDDVEMSIGKGFSNLNLGARLRYEFAREFAPYLGVEWSKNFYNTNDLAPLDEIYAIAGLRFWF